MFRPGGPSGLLTLSVALLVLMTSGSIAGVSEYQIRKRANANAVRVVTGSIDDTAFRIGADLSAVLDQAEDFRILPIMGKGSLQNVTDILYLKGVDLGIVQSDVLAYVRDRKIHKGLARRLNYITKLYNEEFHLLARKDIKDIRELDGKRVNVGPPGDGTKVTASIVFETLGISIEPSEYDNALALQRLQAGELDAIISVAAKPTDLLGSLAPDENIHFLSVPRTPELLQTYLPGRLKAGDYPNLIAENEEVETLSVGAILAVFAWKADTKRYQNVARFVDRLFGNIGDFKKKPRHRKWSEVSLQASVPGWTRFPAAQQWLDERLSVLQADAASERMYRESELNEAFKAFLEKEAPKLTQSMNETQQDALFEKFLAWFKRKPQ